MDAARAWMVSIKNGIPCADCREVFPVYVMHWDHLPGFEKVADVSSMVRSRSRDAVLEELKKCELVCANCHVLRTIRRPRGRSVREHLPVLAFPCPTVGVERFELSTS